MTKAPFPYPYFKNNPIDSPFTYTYTPFLGSTYIDEWRKYRRLRVPEFLKPTGINSSFNIDTETYLPLSNEIESEQLLDSLIYSFNLGNIKERQWYWLKWFIKRFEVTKKLYSSYQIHSEKAKGYGSYNSLEIYIKFARLMSLSSSLYNHLPSLNALLKCNDILCCYYDNLLIADKYLMASIINSEIKLVNQLSKQILKNCNNKYPKPFESFNGNVVESYLENILFLAADTLRSRCYAQTLLKSGFKLSECIIVSSSKENKLGQSNQRIKSNISSRYSINIDLEIPLLDTLQKIASNIQIIDSGTVNSDEIINYIKSLNLKFIIYSGFGGEIVSERLLKTNVPFLHMHAGWLPDYRGSTTSYYSVLSEGFAGVSAILLSSKIDEGNVVARKRYFPPLEGSNWDYEYDSLIRSDLLIELLASFTSKGKLPDGFVQNAKEGDTFYIIHPVLKNLLYKIVEK